MLWLAVFIVPIAALLLAAAFGGIQLAVYALLARCGVVERENIPIFPILAFRGMLLTLAGIATTAILIKTSGVKFWEDPLLSPEAQEGYREVLDPELREQRREAAEQRWREQQESDPDATPGGEEGALIEPPSEPPSSDSVGSDDETGP